MFEFSVATGGLPSPETPWPLVLAVCARSGRIMARHTLSTLDAVHSAIGATLGGDRGGQDRLRDELFTQAYPVKRTDPVFMVNLFAPDDSGEAYDA